nr:MAG: hypothetical protein 3 [Leviviridae sp.]
MIPRKESMNRLTSLWRELALECAGWCGTSAERDIKTVSLRVKEEGESFLTITLPQFAKAFERALETGALDSSLFPNFGFRGGCPRFLGGFLCQIFDPSGVLLDDPSVDCIRSVRQLTMVFGKIERQCSDARIARAMRQFVKVEQELAAFDTSSLEDLLPLFRQASTLLWADVFAHVENSILDKHQLVDKWLFPLNEEPMTRTRKGAVAYPERGKTSVDPLDVILGVDGLRQSSHSFFATRGFRLKHELYPDGIGEVVDPSGVLSLVPRHGPGATADKLRGNAKFSVSQWPRRLENVFPYGDYALPLLASEDELDRIQFLEPGAEVPVKVTPVPKTDKTPRIIAIEPTAMQYMQQALCHQVVYRLEHSDEFRPPLGGKEFDLGKWFIGFADQEANRFLACKSSLDGSLATLDLSEASDRVLNSHVQLLFERFPRLSEAVQATRSTRADVPGEGVIPLTKFASMGSALCFPVEAMVFSTIVLCAIAYERRTSVNRSLLYELRGKVRVYGDDIVVPVDCVQRVIQFLELFGLVVNKDKSFWNGKFRESCGGDYFQGEWVTPIRLRNELPRSLADVDEVVGLVAFRNLLYWGGYWKTVAKLDDRLSTLLKGRWKVVESTTAGLGRESVLPYQVEWFDSETHSPRIAGAAVKYRTPDSPTSGSGALVKFLIKRGVMPSQDKNHLERQGRPVGSRIKLQGIRPY